MKFEFKPERYETVEEFDFSDIASIMFFIGELNWQKDKSRLEQINKCIEAVSELSNISVSAYHYSYIIIKLNEGVKEHGQTIKDCISKYFEVNLLGNYLTLQEKRKNQGEEACITGMKIEIKKKTKSSLTNGEPPRIKSNCTEVRGGIM